MITTSELSKLKMKKGEKVLAVFPHPDDETGFAAGFLMKCVKEGLEVKVVCMTKGEAGKSFSKNGDNESLASIRSEELKKAVLLFGVTDYVIEDFGDGRMEEAEESISVYLKTLIESYKPDYVLTLEPCGIYGHPDHIVLTKLVDAIYESSRGVKGETGGANLGNNADAGGNFKLIYATVSKDEVFRSVRKEMAKNPESIIPIKPNVILVLDWKEIRLKLNAFSSHKSQFRFSPMFFIRWIWRGLLNKEFFHFRDYDF